MHGKSLIPGFAFAFASISQPSVAQEAGESGAAAAEDRRLLEEIIVTARFRDESVDDVGQTINLYTGDELRRRGVVDFDDIVRITPGLDSLSRGPGRNLPYIRGISSQNANGDFFNQPSANTIFFDEVPITLLTINQTEVPLMDLGRVEVIKGSQPTYFGEGSVGGSIRFFSRDPSLNEIETRFGSEISSTRGGDLSYSVDASFGIPIVEDRLGLRVGAIREDRSGFIDNVTEGKDDVNGYERLGVTAVLLFEPNDSFAWRLSGFYQDQDVGSEQAASLDVEDLDLTVPGPDTRDDESVLVANKLRWDIRQVTVESVTGYFRRTFDRVYYDTFNTDNLNNLFMLPGTVVSNSYQRDETFSQELRLITNFDSAINFVGGVYYTDSDANARGFATTDSFFHTVIFGTDTFFGSDFYIEGEQLSVFAEAQLSLLEDRLRIAFGGRYYDQEFVQPYDKPVATVPALALVGLPSEIDANFLGVDAVRADVEEVLLRGQVEYRLSEETLLYASVAEGARNGLFNSGGTLLLGGVFPGTPLYDELIAFEPDFTLTFEAGIKTAFADGAARLSLAAFYTDWDEIQTNLRFVSFNLTNNVGDADIRGIEAELNWQIGPNLEVYAAVNYQDADFSEDVPLLFDANAVPTAFAPEGTRIPQVSNHSGSVGFEWRAPDALPGRDVVVGASYSRTGRRLNNLELNDLKHWLPALDLVHAQVGIETSNWSAFLFAYNLTDEVVPTFDIGESLYDLQFINRPRTVGIRLRADL